MKKTFHITKADIAAGKQNNCMRCPAALAIRREYPEAVVYSDLVSLVYPVRWAAMPANLRRFVRDFDLSRKRRPMSFVLEVAL